MSGFQGSTSTYPHMCRDGHPEIGHADSEHEQCPLCRTLAELALALATFTEDERALLHRTAIEKHEYASRCAKRCSQPNRPDAVKAQWSTWQHQADLWSAIVRKTSS
jgi:hypothetical protein